MSVYVYELKNEHCMSSTVKGFKQWSATVSLVYQEIWGCTLSYQGSKNWVPECLQATDSTPWETKIYIFPVEHAQMGNLISHQKIKTYRFSGGPKNPLFFPLPKNLYVL
jgi:hypothetical protein